MKLRDLYIGQLVVINPEKDCEIDSKTQLYNPLNIAVIKNITINTIGEIIAYVEIPIGYNKWHHKNIHLNHLTAYNNEILLEKSTSCIADRNI